MHCTRKDICTTQAQIQWRCYLHEMCSVALFSLIEGNEAVVRVCGRNTLCNNERE